MVLSSRSSSVLTRPARPDYLVPRSAPVIARALPKRCTETLRDAGRTFFCRTESVRRRRVGTKWAAVPELKPIEEE
jgi:hypothetical protein